MSEIRFRFGGSLPAAVLLLSPLAAPAANLASVTVNPTHIAAGAAVEILPRADAAVAESTETNNVTARTVTIYTP